jgi:hypothetical protein
LYADFERQIAMGGPGVPFGDWKRKKRQNLRLFDKFTKVR